mmetsp:Transcript_34269/g.80086  ORF Transcript_34269/g.80086 Transcript_34269/m.80086 type:complete len:216 (+) Transcript_34269:1170-1817(+)
MPESVLKDHRQQPAIPHLPSHLYRRQMASPPAHPPFHQPLRDQPPRMTGKAPMQLGCPHQWPKPHGGEGMGRASVTTWNACWEALLPHLDSQMQARPCHKQATPAWLLWHCGVGAHAAACSCGSGTACCSAMVSRAWRVSLPPLPLQLTPAASVYTGSSSSSNFADGLALCIFCHPACLRQHPGATALMTSQDFNRWQQNAVRKFLLARYILPHT